MALETTSRSRIGLVLAVVAAVVAGVLVLLPALLCGGGASLSGGLHRTFEEIERELDEGE